MIFRDLEGGGGNEKAGEIAASVCIWATAGRARLRLDGGGAGEFGRYEESDLMDAFDDSLLSFSPYIAGGPRLKDSSVGVFSWPLMSVEAAGVIGISGRDMLRYTEKRGRAELAPERQFTTDLRQSFGSAWKNRDTGRVSNNDEARGSTQSKASMLRREQQR